MTEMRALSRWDLAKGIERQITTPLRTSEFSRARFGDQLMFILPNDVAGVSGREDFDMNAAGLQSQLQLMHLLDVFGRDRLEPRQPRLALPFPAAARKLARNRQIDFEPAINLADLAKRPSWCELAIPRFIERLEQAKPLPLALDQAEAHEPDINSDRLIHRRGLEAKPDGYEE